MNITAIIDDIQNSIIQLQKRLDELRVLDQSSANDILLTRQESADLLGESLRQLDRDCNRYGIRKINTINGVRIRKRDLLIHMGLMADENHQGPMSDLDRIIQKAARK